MEEENKLIKYEDFDRNYEREILEQKEMWLNKYIKLNGECGKAYGNGDVKLLDELKQNADISWKEFEKYNSKHSSSKCINCQVLNDMLCELERKAKEYE